MSVKRAIYLTGSLLLVVLVLAACGGATPVAPQAAATQAPAAATQAPAATAAATEAPAAAGPNALSVLEWAGYDTVDFWADFKASHADTNVSFDFGQTDSDIYSKALAGSTEDIFHFYTPFLPYYVDKGLLKEIDVSKITNWSKLPKRFQDVCTVNGKVYCVPWDWGYDSILYRTDKVPEGVNSWSALFDPKYKGHVAMWDDGVSAVIAAAFVKGYDPLKLTDQQLSEIKQMWIAQKPLNKTYWTTDTTDLDPLVKSGDVWIAYSWQGSYQRLLIDKQPVAYANPKEGRETWIGQYGISAKTQNYDLALAFLDAKLGEQNAKNLLNEYAYGHPIADYFKFATDPILRQALSLDDPSVMDHSNFTPYISDADRQKFVQLWTEVKAAP
jgi:spermidine/putrescine transport system substrate-binding protein